MAESRQTKAHFAQMDPELEFLQKALGEMGWDGKSPNGYRIFASHMDAVKFFKFPKRTDYRGIPIIMVKDFPARLVVLVHSTDYITDGSAG